MRVLVTGGTGFLGSHLVEALLEQPGAEVYALVRDPAKPRWLKGTDGVRFITGDLESVPELPAGLTAVYHLAGLTKTHRTTAYYSVNQEGTASLLRALESQAGPVRFVHLSSLAAVGPSEAGRPVTETDSPAPVSPYGRSKLLSEEEVLKRRDRFSVVILRAAAVYGPRDEDFLEYLRWVRRGVKPIIGRQVLSMLFIRDAVRACLVAGKPGRPSGEIFNIADPQPHTWDDISQIASRHLEKRTVPILLPVWTATLAALTSAGLFRLRGKGDSVFNLSKVKQMKQDWIADTSKARRELGFETLFTLEQGLAETIAWYRWQGWL
jgi:nucleoside-diphosphate-sugar epimerase